MATDLKSPPATFKSKIWKHFGFRQEDKDGKVVTEFTTCRHCDMNVSYKCGNTTNMATHLKRHHKDIYESLSHELSRKKEKTTTQESSNTSCTTGQLRLQDVLHKRMTFSSPRAVAITKSIGQFIAVDMRPFSVVETSGFKHMINTLEPKYSIPSRAHFSEKIIPEIYSETVNRVKNELSQADFIALTTDGWTSKATQSYNTVTAHFIDNDWNLKCYVLQTRPLFESHTAENLADVLQETVKEWKLKRTVKVGEVLSDKRIAVTTDNASNIVKGVNLAGFEPHIRCFAHCLNLAAHKAMQISSVSQLLGRMRRIVTFFHSSSTATKKLKDKQKALNLPAKRLVQDVKTRWNSSFDMMSTFLEQQPAVYATLTEKDIKKNLKEVVTLFDTDISLAEELVDVLKPLKTITTIMCEEKSPTISLVHLMKERLLRQLRENESDSGLAAQAKTEIRNDIESRYSDPDIIRWLEMCCALDPRFKTLPFHDQVEANRVYGNLVDMTESEEVRVKMEPDQSPSTSDDAMKADRISNTKGSPDSDESVESSPKRKKLKSAMEDLFGDIMVVNVEPGKPIRTRAENEIHKYRASQGIQLKDNPLAWWRENQDNYPILSRLARSYLAIQGTSVPSERVFSTAGDIVSAQRAALSPENVDILIFLKKNLQF